MTFLQFFIGGMSVGEKAVVVGSGFIGALVGYAFGGWSGLVETFFFALALDYVTGVAASLKEGKGIDSNTGLWGLFKKALMILAVVFSHRADLAFGTDYIMMGMLVALLTNEVFSIAENYARIGLPLGEKLKPLLTILKDKNKS